jgi:glycosyltransferase involved in cell wall biosynthesis
VALVDVIIPVYNTPIGYVREALVSVRAQTFADWQAIVVNDGSAPAFTVQLKQLVAELDDPRIRYVQSDNRGLPAARNLGIESGSAPFVALLDSDDAWHANKLERQLAVMQASPDVALVHACTDLLHGDDASGLQRVPPRDRGLNQLSQRQMIERMLQGNIVAVNTALFRREAGAAVGFFDADFRSLEDKEFWTRLLLSGARFLHMAETIAIYRMHGSNMSKNVDKMRNGRLQLVSKLDRLVPTGPEWLRQEWPALRRNMVRHANQEAAETYLESGRFPQALRELAPWRCGLSGHTLRLAATALLGVIGLRRHATGAAAAAQG